MIQAFIKLRFKQIFRDTKVLGLIRIIVLIVLSSLSVIGLFIQTEKTPNSFYVTGLYLTIITLIHVNRHDKRFLQIHFSNSKLIFLTEYLLLMSPLFICLIYNNQWISLISSIALTSLIINHPVFSKAIRLIFDTYWNMGITLEEYQKQVLVEEEQEIKILQR